MRHNFVLSSPLCSVFSLLPRAISTILVVLIAVVSLSISTQVNAIATNPITTQCSNNQVRDELSDADYFSLLPNNRSNKASNPNAITIVGKESKPIPLKIKMTKTESGTNVSAIVNESFSSFSKNGNRGIFIHQTFNNKVGEAQANINIEFIDSRDPTGNTPLYLDKVGLSAFDIDDSGGFDDHVIVTGVNRNGATVEANLQNLGTASEVDYGNFNSTGFRGLYTRTGNNCDEQSLETRCQGSVAFNDPVKSITIIYTNRTGRITPNKTTTQGIEFRLDNYCYAPPRVFSGIVFNDNGGANDNNANDRDANLNSTSSIYSNSEYFNGLFNPPERGIAGSTVQLVDNCSNPTQTYATKELTSTAADSGRYTFRVEQAALGSQTSFCLIETGNTATPTPYSVRTTTNKIPVSIVANTFVYANNNFGRVIAKNAALVLEKEQFAHDCNLASLTDTSIPYTQSPISGNDIEPGECIAYRIIATNRARINIGSIVIKDKLQVKDTDGAKVTSFLAIPPRTSAPNTVGYSDGLNVGDNGEIVTNTFNLSPRSKQFFYFNTQYGSSQSN